MKCLLTNRLAECRAAKGMNKSKLAFRLKMTRAYVTRLERGDIRPSVETAIRIARIFGQPVEKIFELVEPVSITNFPFVPGCGQEPITTPEKTSKQRK